MSSDSDCWSSHLLMLPHICKSCHRVFKSKSLFANHVQTCEFFTNRRSGAYNAREIESTEDPVCMQDMLKYVQFLASQNAKMQHDIDLLKSRESRHAGRRKRDAMSDPALNPVPAHTFDEWSTVVFKHTCIPEECFQAVWDGDLVSGIKSFVGAEIAKLDLNAPVRCFSSKKPVIFHVYQEKQQQQQQQQVSASTGAAPLVWRVMSADEWRRWMEKLEALFLRQYLQSTSGSAEEEDDEEEEEEEEEDGDDAGEPHRRAGQQRRNQEMARMMKLSDSKLSSATRSSLIRRWIVSHILYDISGSSD